MSVRALLEQACALDYLVSRIDIQHSHLVKVVWPSIVDDELWPEPTEDQLDLRVELIRFAVGGTSKLDDDDTPPPINEGGASDANSKLLSGNIPAQLKSLHVTVFIKYTSSKNEYCAFYSTYRLLSEYCHPNSASRSVDFASPSRGIGKRVFADYADKDFRIGIMKVWPLAASVLPGACKIVDSSMDFLRSCVMPMPTIDQHAEPSTGKIQVIDPHGRLLYVPIEKIQFHARQGPGLTSDQEARIKKISLVFKDVIPLSFDDELDLFRSDGLHAESELRIWEHFAEVYQREISERPKAGSQERLLLLIAIIRSVEFQSTEAFRSICPELRMLSHLDRVFLRVHRLDGRVTTEA